MTATSSVSSRALTDLLPIRHAAMFRIDPPLALMREIKEAMASMNETITRLRSVDFRVHQLAC